MDYGVPMCAACVHLISEPKMSGEKPTCTAFPGGIPLRIYYERGDHRKPWPGDDGVRFQQDPSKPPLDEFYSTD